MGRFTFYLFAVCLLFTMCKKQDDKAGKADFSMLNGSTFILKVNRISAGSQVQFPHDSLMESDYKTSDENIQHEVSFSEDGQTVSITPGPVTGVKTRDNAVCKYFELSGGIFAGGRFLIWISDDGFEAEFTVYGSGVPIIRSERGDLELKAD
jgi:hypothetical protein